MDKGMAMDIGMDTDMETDKDMDMGTDFQRFWSQISDIDQKFTPVSDRMSDFAILCLISEVPVHIMLSPI